MRFLGFIALFMTAAVAAFGFDAEAIGYSILAAGPAAAGSITIGEMADELKKLFTIQPGLPAKWFYDKEIQLRKYSRRIANVKGEYHIPFALMGPVIQGFKKDWTPLGKIDFLARKIENYHLKIDLPIDPSDILGMYLGEFMYEENKAQKDRSIAMYIANYMGERVVHDMSILSMDGEYDASLMNSQFGYSMKGLSRILTEGIAATVAGTATHPYFLIPAVNPLDRTDDTTYDNIIGEIRNFERSIPKRFRKFVKAIHVERFWYDEYMDQYRALHGGDTLLKEGDYTKTYGGLTIVPHDSDKLGETIFATIENNLLDLVDANDVPKIHDVQTDKRQIVLLGEGRAGFDFGINQAVFVRSEATSSLGLQNAAQNTLFYDFAEVSTSGSGS